MFEWPHEAICTIGPNSRRPATPEPSVILRQRIVTGDYPTPLTDRAATAFAVGGGELRGLEAVRISIDCDHLQGVQSVSRAW
jgi:hypothetical protein